MKQNLILNKSVKLTDTHLPGETLSGLTPEDLEQKKRHSTQIWDSVLASF